jgi:uncharacterized protein YbaR (Trm112 family)
MAAGLLSVIRCPRCGGALEEGDQGLRCAGCRTVFPSLQGIPCLFAEPGALVDEWRRQVGVYQELVQRGVQSMSEQLQGADLLPATRQRLEALRTATADNAERVLSLFRGAGLPPAASQRSGAQLDDDFLLIEYYDHLLRDWAWDGDSDENARARDAVLASLGDDRQLGRTLVLGAGACRLAYDLHLRCKSPLTVALDISPLFLIAAKRIMFGNGLRLFEFPAFPRELGSGVVERELRAPAGSPQNLHLVLADAFVPPLAPASFDTVVTPWFIDIVPVDVRETLALVHGLLVPGGRWLNQGPLNYPKDRPHAQRYSPEELAALVKLAGFEAGPVHGEDVALLSSQAAANGRRERVLTFAARKQPALPSSDGDPPPWLMLPHLPIPRFPGLDGFRADHPVLKFVAEAIDGRATLGDIARRMVKEHGARPDAALGGTRAILTLVYRGARAG